MMDEHRRSFMTCGGDAISDTLSVTSGQTLP